MQNLFASSALVLALALASVPSAKADANAYVFDGWTLESPTSGDDLIAKLKTEFADDEVSIKGAELAASADWKTEFRVSARDLYKVKTTVTIDGTTIRLFQGTILRERGSSQVDAMVIEGEDLAWLAGKCGVETEGDDVPGWLKVGLTIAFPLAGLVDALAGILGL